MFVDAAHGKPMIRVINNQGRIQDRVGLCDFRLSNFGYGANNDLIPACLLAAVGQIVPMYATTYTGNCACLLASFKKLSNLDIFTFIHDSNCAFLELKFLQLSFLWPYFVLAC